MAATMERLDEYRTYNAQFCKRIFDYLSIMIVAQVSVIIVLYGIPGPDTAASPNSFSTRIVELSDRKDVDDPLYLTIKAWSPILADMLAFFCI